MVNTTYMEEDLWELFKDFIPEPHKERIKNEMSEIVTWHMGDY